MAHGVEVTSKNLSLEEVMRRTVGLDDGHLYELRRMLEEAFVMGHRTGKDHPDLTAPQVEVIRNSRVLNLLNQPIQSE